MDFYRNIYISVKICFRNDKNKENLRFSSFHFSKKRGRKMKRKVTLSVDSKTYSDFRKYCEKNAIMLSKRVEIIMKELMKRGDKK